MDEHRIALVLSPDFGDRLAPLAERVHVWVVDSPTNHEAAQRVWQEFRHDQSLDRGITTFDAAFAESRETMTCAILETIAEHHGPFSHTPELTVIEVYGFGPSKTLRGTLAELGFTDIVMTADGFEARRRDVDRD